MRVALFALLAALAAACETVEDNSLAAGPVADTVITPPWAEAAPTSQDIMNAYPRDALNQEIEGLARLSCTVRPTRRLVCTVASETPPGYGFGAAGLEVAKLFVMRADHPQAKPGTSVIVPVRFVVR